MNSSKKRMRTTTFVAILASVVVLFAVLGTGGTYAMWTDRYEVPPMEISSGNAKLETYLVGSSEVGPLFPGESRSVPLMIDNEGQVDLEVTASVTSEEYITATLIDESTCGSGGDALETVRISAGDSRQMCLYLSLESTTPNREQGQVSVVNIAFNGDSGAWRADTTLAVNVALSEITVDVYVEERTLLQTAQLTIINTSPVALNMDLDLREDTLQGPGLIYISDTSCDDSLLNLLGLPLGGELSLGIMQPGEIKDVCLSSSPETGQADPLLTAQHPDSQWSASFTPSPFSI